MSKPLNLNPLISEHEQDMAHALAWWKQTANADKVRVWQAIQDLGGTETEELISRFAQLGFTQLALTATTGESK